MKRSLPPAKKKASQSVIGLLFDLGHPRRQEAEVVDVEVILGLPKFSAAKWQVYPAKLLHARASLVILACCRFVWLRWKMLLTKTVAGRPQAGHRQATGRPQAGHRQATGRQDSFYVTKMGFITTHYCSTAVVMTLARRTQAL